MFNTVTLDMQNCLYQWAQISRIIMWETSKIAHYCDQWESKNATNPSASKNRNYSRVSVKKKLLDNNLIDWLNGDTESVLVKRVWRSYSKTNDWFFFMSDYLTLSPTLFWNVKHCDFIIILIRFCSSETRGVYRVRYAPHTFRLSY